MLIILENLISKIQKPSSPHDQIWVKLYFWIYMYNCIQIYHVVTFVSEKDSLGPVFSNSEIFRLKGEGHQMTKYRQKYIFGTITLF